MEKVDIEFYSICQSFLPKNINSLEKDTFLYVVNYYGLISPDYFNQLVTIGNVIVDNSQAFFAAPIEGCDTIYTCRKFFGVADGGYLVTEAKEGLDLEIDTSSQYVGYLFGRLESCAEDFYSDFRSNEARLDKSEIKKMSSVTRNLLSIVDYELVKRKRSENFIQMHQQLRSINQIKIPDEGVEGAYIYPFMAKDSGMLRGELIKRKIYIPMLWPNVIDSVSEGTLEYMYAKDILPLPCDQRYGVIDIEHIANIIKNLMEGLR